MAKFTAKNAALQDLLKMLMPSMLSDLEVKKGEPSKEIKTPMGCGKECEIEGEEEIKPKHKASFSLMRIIADQKEREPKNFAKKDKRK